jgi:hypothetical protein
MNIILKKDNKDNNDEVVFNNFKVTNELMWNSNISCIILKHQTDEYSVV